MEERENIVCDIGVFGFDPVSSREPLKVLCGENALIRAMVQKDGFGTALSSSQQCLGHSWCSINAGWLDSLSVDCCENTRSMDCLQIPTLVYFLTPQLTQSQSGSQGPRRTSLHQSALEFGV